jgi:hypothetical protein
MVGDALVGGSNIERSGKKVAMVLLFGCSEQKQTP